MLENFRGLSGSQGQTSKFNGLMMRLKFGHLGIIGILFFLGTTPLDANAQTKELIWIGFGEAEGNYQEDLHQFDEEIKGSTYEYSELEYEVIRDSGKLRTSPGQTKSFSLQYTSFDPVFIDQQGRKHFLSLTEITPYWSRGLTYIVHMGKTVDWVNSAELLLGIGFITFEKEVENLHKFDHKWGYELSYGYGMNSLFKFDEGWFFGWRSLVKNNRISLEYGEDYGYLTHRRDILFIIGKTFRGTREICVPTAYVPCD